MKIKTKLKIGDMVKMGNSYSPVSTIKIEINEKYDSEFLNKIPKKNVRYGLRNGLWFNEDELINVVSGSEK